MALLGKRDEADDGDSAASAKAVSNRLRALEERRFTGAVEVSVKGSNAAAQIYYFEGGIYAAHLDGYRPVLMDRLRTDGVLDQARWSDLAAIFGAHRPHVDVGPMVVEQEWMSVDELVNLHQELLIAALCSILSVPKARIERETSATTGAYCSLPQDVPRLLRLVQGRQQRTASAWASIGVDADPGSRVLRTTSTPVPSNLDRDEFRAVLDVVDPDRSIDEMADVLGLTRGDLARVASLLVLAGVLEVDPERRIAAPTDRLLVPEAWGGRLEAAVEAAHVASEGNGQVRSAVAPVEAARAPVVTWPPPIDARAPELPVPEPEPMAEPDAAADPEPTAEPEPQSRPEQVDEPESGAEPQPHRDERQHALWVATTEALRLEQLLSESVTAEQEAIARSAVIRERLRECLATVARLTATDPSAFDEVRGPRRD